MARSQDTTETATAGVLPFTTAGTNLHEGMGTIERIVSLGAYNYAEGVTTAGLCVRCGYDRGMYFAHTEVDGFTVECDHCNHPIVSEGEF